MHDIQNFQVNVNGANTSQTIGGLIPFTEYTCELYAATVLNGPATDPVTIRTAEQGIVNTIDSLDCITLSLIAIYAAPTPPEIKTLTVIDSKSVLLEWNRPERVNGILIFYTIIYVTDSGTMTSIVAFDGSQVSILTL